MPLPDAIKRSPRVYTLLQNLDLENITADTLADVADPIAIEEANEDELRRLCLVAFARMVTKGSFDGWLSGGSSFRAILPIIPPGTSGPNRYQITNNGPFGGTREDQNIQFADYDKPRAYPFISPQTGDVDEVGITVSTATDSADMLVAIYTDSSGQPLTLLGTATIAMDATGDIYQTSMSATISLESGQQYWYAILWAGDTATAGVFKGTDQQYQTPIGIGENPYTEQFCARHDTVTTSAPATWSSDRVVQTARPFISLKIS